MNQRSDGTTGPREPVVITVGAARVVKHTEEQNRRNGTQNNSTNGNNQTPSTSRSTPTHSTIARVSNTSGASVELVTVQAGSQSTGNSSTFYTAPSTPRRRLDSGTTTPRPATVSVRPGIESATKDNNSIPKECGYCGNMFSNMKILHMHWSTVESCNKRRLANVKQISKIY